MDFSFFERSKLLLFHESPPYTLIKSDQKSSEKRLVVSEENNNSNDITYKPEVFYVFKSFAKLGLNHKTFVSITIDKPLRVTPLLFEAIEIYHPLKNETLQLPDAANSLAPQFAQTTSDDNKHE